MLAAAIPDERAARDPAGACVADERQELDNARFAQTVSAVAALLADAGLRRGGVLAVMLPNRVELITGMFAAWRLGAAVTPVNPALTGQEARYQVDDAGANVVIADGASAAKLAGGGYRIIPVQDVTSPARPGQPVPAQAEPGTPALLIYTSGTTGRPKGVILDHRNIQATAELIVTWFEMAGETRSLLVLPLFHVNAIMVSVVSPLLAGGSTFIAERFDAATFWATVGQARPTFFSAVPTICALLVSRPGEQADTKNLRYVICGAAPMPRELIREFEQRFGVPVVAGYGLPECTVVCTANPVHGVRKAGSVGLALPGVEVGVADPAGESLPVGQAGEVVVRGPNVMRGYLGRPAESAEVLRGGWLHTGDVGRFDDDGYLILVDRVKDRFCEFFFLSGTGRGTSPGHADPLIARAYGATGSIAFQFQPGQVGLADEKCTPGPLPEGRNAMSQTKDIREAVALELSYDPLVDDSDISVKNLNGDVALNGTVPSYPQYLAAAAAARRVAGVTKLQNHLEVVLPPENYRDDPALTTTANDALTLNVAVPDGVEATAKDGNITLAGTVSYGAERIAAEQAVTYLTGVRNVKDDIDISTDADPVDVTLNVQDALDRYALIPDDSDVAVDTSGNTVTLTGHVRTWAEHDAVVDAAWRATGVYDVTDDLYVTG